MDLTGLTQGQAEVDPVGKAQGHDISVVFAEFQRGGILRQGGDVHLEEINRELTVNVMQLIFVFFVVLIQIRLIDLLKVVKIIRAFRIDTLMDDEVLAILLVNEGVAAVWAAKVQGRKAVVFFRREAGIADFT